MSDNLAMATQLAGQAARVGWYFALNRALDWRTSQLKETVEAPLSVLPAAAGALETIFFFRLI